MSVGTESIDTHSLATPIRDVIFWWWWILPLNDDVMSEERKGKEGKADRRVMRAVSGKAGKRTHTHTLTSARQKLIELTAQLPVREEQRKKKKERKMQRSTALIYSNDRLFCWREP